MLYPIHGYITNVWNCLYCIHVKQKKNVNVQKHESVGTLTVADFQPPISIGSYFSFQLNHNFGVWLSLT